MDEDVTSVEPDELRDLKAAVFGRDAARLPAGERAELEARLTRLLEHADAERRAAEAERRTMDIERAVGAAGNLAVGSPVESAGAREAEPEPAPISRWARRALHPLALALALVLVAVGSAMALHLADQSRDSLAVFRVPPTDADALPEWAAIPDRLDSRFLGELAGFGVFGAITDDNRVCLIALHLPAGGAGTCVTHEVFSEHGVHLRLEGGTDLVPGNGAVTLEWGPQGPASVSTIEALER